MVTQPGFDHRRQSAGCVLRTNQHSAAFYSHPSYGSNLCRVAGRRGAGIKAGAASLALYIAEGALGLPFFAGGVGGLHVLVGATAGYLIGFIAASYVIGRLAERGLERTVRTSFIPFAVGTLIIYLFGVTWLALMLGNLSKAIAAGLLPFIIGDAIKLIAAALALPAAWKLVK